MSVQVDRDRVYASHARGRVDIYFPPSSVAEPARPLVIFFHGGSWQSGSKRQVAAAARALAGGGLVVATPNYRLYPEVRFEGFMRDAAAVVAVLRRDAARWGADPDRIVLSGYSAGGHIASLLAFDPQWLDAAGVPPRAVAAFVGVAGTYDFLPYEAAEYGAVFGPAEGHARAQPIVHVNPGSPPALILHGNRDRVVPEREPEALARALARAGVRYTLRYYPGLDHGTLLQALASSAPLPRVRGAEVPVRADFTAFVRALPPRATAVR